jgi:membrane-associated phospholipid phosphatase
MSHLPYHQQQLEFMKSLASHRIEWLDPFFRFLQFFDSPYFFFILIPIVWLGYSYQWGLRLFYWFTLNNLVNSFAKHAVGWPRPSTDLPELGLFHPICPGFPSGGAQSCLFLGGILIYYWRTRAAWVIGSIYILLISFSRLYLGVHYPIDILGGWTIAAIILSLFIYTKDPLEKWLAKKGHFFCLILSLLIPAAVMFLMPRKGVYYIIGSTMGVGIGTYFSLKYHLFLPRPKKISEGMGRSIIGIATLFLIVLLWPSKQSFAQSFTAGLFMSLAASPICKWFMDKKINR